MGGHRCIRLAYPSEEGVALLCRFIDIFGDRWTVNYIMENIRHFADY